MCCCLVSQLPDLHQAVHSGEEEWEHGPHSSGKTEGARDWWEQEGPPSSGPDPPLWHHPAGKCLDAAYTMIFCFAACLHKQLHLFKVFYSLVVVLWWTGLMFDLCCRHSVLNYDRQFLSHSSHLIFLPMSAHLRLSLPLLSVILSRVWLSSPPCRVWRTTTPSRRRCPLRH